MKKAYIKPELEENLIQTDYVLTIIPTSGDSSSNTEDNPLVVDSKLFDEFEDEEEEW